MIVDGAVSVAANAVINEGAKTITVNVALNSAATADNDKITVTAGTVSANASANGPITLTKAASAWPTTSKITVTAQDGSTQDYTIAIVEA